MVTFVSLWEEHLGSWWPPVIRADSLGLLGFEPCHCVSSRRPGGLACARKSKGTTIRSTMQMSVDRDEPVPLHDQVAAEIGAQSPMVRRSLARSSPRRWTSPRSSA